MKIRYFLGFAIIYIALVSVYAFFYISPESYTLHNTLWFEFSLTLPIAIWLVLPVAVLLVLAWIFMSLDFIIIKFKALSFNRDADKILTQIEDQMLGNVPHDRIYANDRFKEISKALKRFYLLPNLESNVSGASKFDEVFEILREISLGENNAKIKLNPSHPLYRINIQNALNKDSKNALGVLKQDINDSLLGFSIFKGAAASDVYGLAWDKIVESKNVKLIIKALELSNNRLNTEILGKLLESIGLDSNALGKIDSMLLVNCVKGAGFSEKDYLNLAFKLAKILNQNNINFYLSFFEKLSKQVDCATLAYFYILLEVGKSNEAQELKSHYSKGDFLPVSAFLELKDKGYPLLAFFNPLDYGLCKDSPPAIESSTTPNAIESSKNHNSLVNPYK